MATDSPGARGAGTTGETGYDERQGNETVRDWLVLWFTHWLSAVLGGLLWHLIYTGVL